jgi:hypothetical protein
LVPTNRIALRDLVVFGGEPPEVLADLHLERDPSIARQRHRLRGVVHHRRAARPAGGGRGCPPAGRGRRGTPVYLSANVPGGDEHNRVLEAWYAGRIRRTA